MFTITSKQLTSTADLHSVPLTQHCGFVHDLLLTALHTFFLGDSFQDSQESFRRNALMSNMHAHMGLHCEYIMLRTSAAPDHIDCGMSQKMSSSTGRLRPSLLTRLAKRGAASVLVAGAGASAWYLYRSAQPEEPHPEQPDLQGSPHPSSLSGIDPHTRQRQASRKYRTQYNKPGSPSTRL